MNLTKALENVYEMQKEQFSATSVTLQQLFLNMIKKDTLK